MIEKNGDLFTTEATYIGHGVNCMGLMGAGVAKTVREKFPQTYEEYQYMCSHNYLIVGDFFPYDENGKVIVNLATQYRPGPDATYEAVFGALTKFSKQASTPRRITKNGNVIAIPEIGCGIGGLEWPVVKKIILLVEEIYPEIEYEVWHYV